MFIPRLPDMFKTKSQFRGTTRLWEVGFYHGYGYTDNHQGRINLSPSYQRPDVWTDEQRCAFIRSIFFGLPIAPFVLNVNSYEREQETGFHYNVIDGKQRLTTIFKFVNDELEVDGLKWSQLDKRIHMKFDHQSLSTIETHFETEEEEAEYYKLFNYSWTNHE